MLGAVSVEKVEAKLFYILYVEGLEDVPEAHLKKYTGLSKKEIADFLARFYLRKDGFYYLKTNQTENIIRLFRSSQVLDDSSAEDQEIKKQISNAEQLAFRIKSRMDSVQKVVRGAIFYNSVFTPRAFRDEIEAVITDIIHKYDIDQKYVQEVADQSNDILVCVMALLHDSKFIFYDRNMAEIHLCLYLGDNFEKMIEPNYGIRKDLYENGVLALYLKGKETIKFPLFVSDLQVKDYISFDRFSKSDLDSTISPSQMDPGGKNCPWVKIGLTLSSKYSCQYVSRAYVQRC